MTTATEAYVEQTTSVAGLRLRRLEGGSGSPLVILHHSTGSPGWMPIHDALARSSRVIAPDMPGYAGSERPEWARDARDLAILTEQLLRKLGLEGVTLVGCGFGGFVAAELAAMAQGRLASLVLIGAAGLQPPPGEGEIMDEMLVDYDEYMKAGFRDDAHYEEVFGADPAKEIRQLWDFSREMTARVAWKPYMFSRRLAPVLAEVEVPTLLIWGSEDRVVPPVCGRLYAQALPRARLETVQGAGHYVEWEEPDTVAGLVAGHTAAAR